MKELYKSCRTLAADQMLLDIIHEQSSLWPIIASHCSICPATATSSTGCYYDFINKILEHCKSIYKVYIHLFTQRSKMFVGIYTYIRVYVYIMHQHAYARIP